MKKLNEIIECSFDIDILGIADDSRLIDNGFLFVATKGYNVDHFDYIDDAIANGAVAIISDRFIETTVPVVIVDDVNSLFPILCQKFYDVIPDDFRLIGITGTDGKTTTASVVRQMMIGSIDVAYIGTNGVDVFDKHYDTNNTTPCISELYKCLSKIKDNNCFTVVMEVSSEALLHNRISGLKFDVIAFTNITEDHLNVHGNIENYRNSKFLLVNYLKDNGKIFVNGDDINCQMLTDKRMSNYGVNSGNNFTIFDVKSIDGFSYFNIRDNSTSRIYQIMSPLLGEYNIYNVTLAFLICLSFNILPSLLIERIKNLNVISGRRELLNFGQKFDIILDYAHTLNGIVNVLKSVSDYKRVITVTGAAGGREKEKRSKIGKAVLEMSDLVIFTMDDPRNESVDDIIDDMISISDKKNFERVIDREKAIFRAFSLANEGDVVLVLGKGRDNYMAIGNKKIPYCDYDVIKKYFD